MFKFKVHDELRFKKVYEILDDIDKMQKINDEGFSSTIRTNYGYAHFHFCYYKSKKIMDYCGEYLSPKEKKKVEAMFKIVGEDDISEIGSEIDYDILMKMIKDHPDIVYGGLLDLGFFMVNWTEYIKENLYTPMIDKLLKSLKLDIKKLENLKELHESSDCSLEFGEVTDYDSDEEVFGLHIDLTLDFVADKKLKDIEDEIERLIKTIKPFLKGKLIVGTTLKISTFSN